MKSYASAFLLVVIFFLIFAVFALREAFQTDSMPEPIFTESTPTEERDVISTDVLIIAPAIRDTHAVHVRIPSRSRACFAGGGVGKLVCIAAESGAAGVRWTLEGIESDHGVEGFVELNTPREEADGIISWKLESGTTLAVRGEWVKTEIFPADYDEMIMEFSESLEDAYIGDGGGRCKITYYDMDMEAYAVTMSGGSCTVSLGVGAGEGQRVAQQ